MLMFLLKSHLTAGHANSKLRKCCKFVFARSLISKRLFVTECCTLAVLPEALLLLCCSAWLPHITSQDDSLVYYSTHSEKDIFDLARELNAMCVAAKEHKLQTVSLKARLH